MKLRSTLSLLIWLKLVFGAASPRDVGLTTSDHAVPSLRFIPTMTERELLTSGERDLMLMVPEERKVFTRAQLEEHGESHGGTYGMLMESGLALYNIDYENQSGEEIAWQVAEALVPIIETALSYIPIVGPLISGIFVGAWSIFSGIFGGGSPEPEEENPMEKIIRQSEARMERMMDNKLRTVINAAIYGEIARNNYICNKYQFVSNRYMPQFQKRIPLDTNSALEVMMYLNDCDNFLKDTSEAFAYEEYADVLWIPGAISTSARLTFLAEIIKIAPLIGMTQEVITMYRRELKQDTARQLGYYLKGHTFRKESQTDLFNATITELAACKLQNQFYYFDSTLYPYGRPEVHIDSATPHIEMKPFYKAYVSKDEKYYGNETMHVQVFVNSTDRRSPLFIMNCVMGPTYLASIDEIWFRFGPMAVNVGGVQVRYSYEFRVLFIHAATVDSTVSKKAPVLMELRPGSKGIKEHIKMYKFHADNKVSANANFLKIAFVEPEDRNYNESQKLINTRTAARWTGDCPYVFIEDGKLQVREECKHYKKFFGSYKLYSAGIFNDNGEKLNKWVQIENPSGKTTDGKWSPGFVVGVEIIMREAIKI